MVLYLLAGLVILIFLIVVLYVTAVYKKPPRVDAIDTSKYLPEPVSESFSRIGKNWLNKNSHGLYEMYIEGAPFERGVVNGRLSSRLIYTQERIFVDEIRKIVPNNIYLGILKFVVAWMNRRLYHFISEEYDHEIYGVSLSASKDFRLIGPNYMRMLNYHAAHDIGHSLQYMNLVGCTSFAASGTKTVDGKIIHARNFDFYVGDEFCKEKIVTFYAPNKGNKFAMITWGALIGTVSGMNLKGIAITVNAAKSKMPLNTATPVTILVREMLQYASTIEEAIDIARNRRISVSESFLISSGRDNRVLIIEKTPYTTEIYKTQEDQIICTNHFQSETLKDDPLNIRQINESASMYRYKRVQELLNQNPLVTPAVAADILRNRFGLKDKPIGNGNELTINQLLAHHSIIFKPSELKMWVSAGQFTLGEYVCYDLRHVFDIADRIDDSCKISSDEEEIKSDAFIHDGGFDNFEKFKQIRKELSFCKKNNTVAQSLVDEFIMLNPEYFLSYSTAGDYFRMKKKYADALVFYKAALEKEIPNLKEKEDIRMHLTFCEKRIKQQH